MAAKCYALIKMDCENNNCDILYHASDFRDILMKLNDIINETYSKDENFSVNYEDSNIISIYAVHYVSKKTVKFRFLIREF